MASWLDTILIVASLLSATVAFVWLAVRVGKTPHQEKLPDVQSVAETAATKIFNDEFREELKNRGRLHFEKVISENAMFLQQDLRLTTAQVHDYMKQEINKSLREAFAKYEESIKDAEAQALQTIKQTRDAVTHQRQLMEQQLAEALDAEKKRLVEKFENNMADIVNHYVLSAIGDQISLDEQLDYILTELENNKKAIIEDIQSGA